MAYSKRINESKFHAIKILLESKATVKEICKYFDVSDTTIYTVKNCENYEEYEQFMAEKNAKRNAALAAKKKGDQSQKPSGNPDQAVPQTPQVVEHRQTVTIQATHYMMEELKKQNELLTLISNKLAFIVEQLN